MNTFVDTNVFVYAKDFSEPERKPIAQAWLDHLWEAGTGRVSIQVLSELFNVLSRKVSADLDHNVIRRQVRDLFAWNPLPVDDLLIQAA
jgi:predicted nucleic acid-binding protein